MSLDAELTASRLRSLAGYAFARGDAYFRDGRVAHCERDGDVIRGIVVGTETYDVEVRVGPRAIASYCSCPVGAGFCKHAVALALHWREHGAMPVRREVSDGFATNAEARAWAEEHHVTHLFATSSDRVIGGLTDPRLRSMSYAFGRMPFGSLVSRDSTNRLVGAAFGAALATAARRVMEHEAEIVATGIAEEAVARRPPATGPCAALWPGLVELRRAVRRDAVPRSRAFRASCTLVCDPVEPSLGWRERAATTALRCRDGRKLELTCSCGARACVHELALIDAALDLFEAASDEASATAAALMQPGWARALAALAERETTVAPERAPIEVWWELGEELGAPSLQALVKKQLKRGGWSAGTRMGGDRLLASHGDALEPRDRAIAEPLAGWGGGGSYPARAFAALVGHPRVQFVGGAQQVAVVRTKLGFIGAAAGSGVRLVPALDGVAIDPRIVGALLDTFGRGEPLVYHDLDREDARVVLIDVSDDARHLAALLAKHGDEFPPESHGQLFERLAALESKLAIAVPDSLKGSELAGEPTVVVRVRIVHGATLELEAFLRPAAGAPLFPPGVGPRDVLVVREGERGYVRRQIGDELALVRGMLARLPMDAAEEGPPLCFQLRDDDALALVLALEQPPPGIEAEWLENRPAFTRAIAPAALRVTLDTKRDWFAIAGGVKIGSERLELAVLLDAARRQRRFVQIGENRWAELSTALRERLGALADHTYAAPGKDRVEVTPAAAPAMRALADAGADVAVPERWKLLADRLAASEKLKPRPPASLRATLRDYQIEGHAWLSRLAAWGAGACLADDMGLGKTVQAIALLVDRKQLGPALVIAPTSVVFNWEAELARFAPELRVVRYGSEADRSESLARVGAGDVVIASYGLLARDGERFAKRTFATLVVDEAQQLKNAQTQRAKAARALDAEFRVALSGTPFENHLGELWSLFSVVFPGLLGSWDQFRDRYAIPIERVKSDSARAALSRVLRPFMLRRTKAEVARELPARTEIELPIELDDGHRELYQDARLAAVAALTDAGKDVRDEQQRFQVLAALTRLRLLACHPKLYDRTSSVPAAKLERLLELLDELRGEGHRALVFSQFTSHLELVQTALATAGYRLLYLDGETPVAKRAERVRAFQDGAADVFLISLKAGGTGLNLTAADYVIHLDPWWNPAVEDQATDRAHRIGQTRPVTVYRLIARGTIEEKILALHATKRSLVAGVLEGTDVAAKLSTKDLLALLGS